jgi:hypothetical protein
VVAGIDVEVLVGDGADELLERRIKNVDVTNNNRITATMPIAGW